MINLEELALKIQKEGYSEENAEAKLCQDILLLLISQSSLSRNVTIKGGVVMRSISNNSRRATQDVDIDFIRYSIEEDSIRQFVSNLNGIEGISVQIIGSIDELKHQDYNGKRVNVRITDDFQNTFVCKLDIGVHKQLAIEQEEYCFQISCQENNITLFINSKEQILVEKLCSILKFGRLSTRYRDLYDIFYLLDLIDIEKLCYILKLSVFGDEKMRENSMEDIYKRLADIFSNKNYIKKLNSSKKNWLDASNEEVLQKILNFFKNMI